MSTHQDGGISVAIANWNGGDHIARCLTSLDAQSRKPEEIIVVDNGSTDGSPSLIRSLFPHVRLLTRPLNEGFCAGYNRAILASRYASVLILNTDVTLDPSFVERASAALADDERIGWVAGTVTHTHPDDQDLHGLYLRRRVSLVNASDPGDNDDVFAGSGAAIFCRKAMLEDVAFGDEIYDESFFAYIEDLDLAWRAQLRGWRCVYRSDLRCQHLGSASQGGRIRILDKSMSFLTHIIKNRYLTLIKNATPGLLVRYGPYFIAGELLLWVGIGIRSPRKLVAILNAMAEASRQLPSALIKRRHIMRRRLVSDRRILSLTRGF